MTKDYCIVFAMTPRTPFWGPFKFLYTFLYDKFKIQNFFDEAYCTIKEFEEDTGITN